MIGRTNAEASSSRLSAQPKANADIDNRRNGGPSAAIASMNPTGPASSRRSSSSAGTKAQFARVRTVPPSAAFDPPSVESLLLEPSPLPHASEAPRPSKLKRPQPKLRYSTSSGSDLEDDTDTDDDEPPWWTFTNRGMAKLRQQKMRPKDAPRRPQPGGARTPRQMEGVDPLSLGPPVVLGRLSDGGGGNGSGDVTESGVESNGPARRRFRRAHSSREPVRQGSKDSERDSPLQPPSFRGSRNTDSPSRIHPPRLLTAHASNLLFHRRRSPGGTETPPELPIMTITKPHAHRLQRSNSAPGSPVPVDCAVQPIASLTAPDQHAAATPSAIVTDAAGTPRLKPIPKRQSTAPSFPFMKRRSGTGENLTDSEAHMFTSPRARAAQARRIPAPTPLTDSPAASPAGSADEAGPSRPHLHQRRGTRLRLALPEPLQQHLHYNWHAGSWQDALYGHYEEALVEPRASRRRDTADSTPRSRKQSAISAPRSSRGSLTGQHPSAEQSTFAFVPSRHGGSSAPSTPHRGEQEHQHDSHPRHKPSRRERLRRKKYRPAMMPPTPRGLGFTPAEERGNPLEARSSGFGPSHDDNGFNWGDLGASAGNIGANGHRQGRHSGATDRIDEGDELARMDTRATTTAVATEKSDGSSRRKMRRTWYGKKKLELEPDPGDPQSMRKLDMASRRDRWFRHFWLDARVTIVVRLFNLAIVVILLGLSIDIRLELHALQLPGVIGPSTTLTIAYAAFTIPHILLVIHKEWRGRPIGLWGLRSKMLFVCADLIFVALWSSAMSLAINDWIATPLECTSDSPWWTHGLEGNYQRLLAGLANLEDAVGPVLNGSLSVQPGWTPADQIRQTFGITLPDAVVGSKLAHEACRRQAASIAFSLITLLLYAINMVWSLFRMFETIMRLAAEKARQLEEMSRFARMDV